MPSQTERALWVRPVAGSWGRGLNQRPAGVWVDSEKSSGLEATDEHEVGLRYSESITATVVAVAERGWTPGCAR